MFIRHPKEKAIINPSRYAEIRCCTVNVTHVDFYEQPKPPNKERGKPAFIVVLDDQEARDKWFEKIAKQLAQ